MLGSFFSWITLKGISVPISYRIIDKKDGKTKHEYFKQMLQETQEWGLKPFMITGDSWYSKKESLKYLKEKEQGFLFAFKSNRQISLIKGEFMAIKELLIPFEGLIVYLKQVGKVKIFRQKFKNEFRYYGIYLSNENELENFTYSDFILIHDHHWKIEQYHRARTTSL